MNKKVLIVPALALSLVVLSGCADNAVEHVQDAAMNKASETMTATMDTAKDMAKEKAGAMVDDMAGTVKEKATDMAKDTMNTVKNSTTGMVDGMKDSAKEMGKDMMEDHAKAMKQVTMAEIAKHATKDDCWLAVDGNVYDVTSFIKSGKHPGGPALLQGCGKDATQLFNTRPMGSGTPHSDKARENIKNFMIGVVVK